MTKRDNSFSPSGSPDFKKANITLDKYLEPNSTYKIEDKVELRYILHVNPRIECVVYGYDTRKMRFHTKNYQDLCVTNHFSSAQHEVFDKFNIGKKALSFTLNGVYMNPTGPQTYSLYDREVIINDLWENYMYVKTDEDSNYHKILIFKYSAPVYNDFEDHYDTEQSEVYRTEWRKLGGFEDRMEAKDAPSIYVQKMNEITMNSDSLPTCYEENSPGVSPNKGGGCDKLKKYKKYLKRQSLTKLQSIAKNKKINYTRKSNGKIVNIKEETLVKNLLNQYAKMNLQ